LLITAVNWAEVTAIATSTLAIGLVGGFVAAVFAAQQVREARRSREAQMAAEFFRRWNEDALVEARRIVGRFKSANCATRLPATSPTMLLRHTCSTVNSTTLSSWPRSRARALSTWS
jgi:hypothetical protein